MATQYTVTISAQSIRESTSGSTAFAAGGIAHQGASESVGSTFGLCGLIWFGTNLSSAKDTNNNTIIWKNEDIKSIAIRYTFAKLGNNSDKKITMWKCNPSATSASLTPVAMSANTYGVVTTNGETSTYSLTAAFKAKQYAGFSSETEARSNATIGTYTHPNAYNTTSTKTLSSGTAFDNLCASIQDGARGWMIYTGDSGKTTTVDWNARYLGVTACTMTITYEHKCTVGDLDKTDLTIGANGATTADQTITFTPSYIFEDSTASSITHTIAWKLNGNTLKSGSGITGATLTSSSYAYNSFVPSATLVNYFKTEGVTSLSGEFDITTVATYSDSSSNFSVTMSYPFTVTISDDWIPIIDTFKVYRATGSTKAFNGTSAISDYTVKNNTSGQSSVSLSMTYSGNSTTGTALTRSASTSATISATSTALSGTVDTGYSYVYTLTASNDLGMSSSKTFTVSKAAATLHINGDGSGVAVGKFSTATLTDKKFECEYPAYFNNGINLNSGSLTNVESTVAFTTSFADTYTYTLPNSGMYIISVSFTGVDNSYLNEILLKVATSSTQSDSDRTTIAASNATGRVSAAGLYYASAANHIVVIRCKSEKADSEVNMRLNILKL